MAFPRFLIAGGLNTALTYLIYLGLLLLMPYIWAYSLTYIIGIGLGYLLNAKWVFKKKTNLRTATIYPLTYGFNYILGVAILWYLVEIIKLSKEIAPLIVVVISMPIMYVLTKAIFKENIIMRQKMTINDCKVFALPKINDPRGNLTFIEGNNHIPFDIKRVFYLYDVPTEENRGAHAHHNLHQFLICLSGSFDVAVDDGEFQATIHLNRPWKGLHIPPKIWAAEVNFDPGSVCLVLASDAYKEDDYIRDYNQFLSIIKNS